MTDEAKNLDCMPEGDLRAYLATLKPRSRLARYARTKLLARTFRATGHIVAAVRLERLCDDIYSQLPEKDRW